LNDLLNFSLRLEKVPRVRDREGREVEGKRMLCEIRGGFAIVAIHFTISRCRTRSPEPRHDIKDKEIYSCQCISFVLVSSSAFW